MVGITKYDQASTVLQIFFFGWKEDFFSLFILSEPWTWNYLWEVMQLKFNNALDDGQ